MLRLREPLLHWRPQLPLLQLEVRCNITQFLKKRHIFFNFIYFPLQRPRPAEDLRRWRGLSLVLLPKVRRGRRHSHHQGVLLKKVKKKINGKTRWKFFKTIKYSRRQCKIRWKFHGPKNIQKRFFVIYLIEISCQQTVVTQSFLGLERTNEIKKINSSDCISALYLYMKEP